MTNARFPLDFACPITKKMMSDPVRTPDGVHFERQAIVQWLEMGHGVCPVTDFPLFAESLRSSPALKVKIQHWQWKMQRLQEREEQSSSAVEEEEEEDEAPSHDTRPSIAPGVAIPAKMQCSLTQRLMVDPVMTKYGHSYERSALLKWLKTRGSVCPVTGQALALSQIVSNNSLKRQIAAFEQRFAADRSSVATVTAPVKAAVATAPAVSTPKAAEGKNAARIADLKNQLRVQRNSNAFVGSMIRNLAFSKSSSDPAHGPSDAGGPRRSASEDIMAVLDQVESALVA